MSKLKLLLNIHWPNRLSLWDLEPTHNHFHTHFQVCPCWSEKSETVRKLPTWRARCSWNHIADTFLILASTFSASVRSEWPKVMESAFASQMKGILWKGTLQPSFTLPIQYVSVPQELLGWDQQHLSVTPLEYPCWKPWMTSPLMRDLKGTHCKGTHR